jgi:hypothetical protein
MAVIPHGTFQHLELLHSHFELSCHAQPNTNSQLASHVALTTHCYTCLSLFSREVMCVNNEWLQR